MPDDTITMQRFTGKARRVTSDRPEASILFGEGITLQFNTEAKNEFLDGVQYVDYYTSEDGTHVGVKPVSGEDVDERSYKLSYNSVSFGAMATELGIDGENPIRAECEWDDDAGMVVIDLMGVVGE